MITTFDIDKQIELTPRFIEAIKELMAAECEMMQEQDPEFADCWTWGRCVVGDLATGRLSFEYGGDEDLPEDGLPRFGVTANSRKE